MPCARKLDVPTRLFDTARLNVSSLDLPIQVPDESVNSCPKDLNTYRVMSASQWFVLESDAVNVYRDTF
jgi:hypothetical protein